eukprot:TRINITY_DN3519_c0_g1_i2.p1 TRINITY_DN3519_c0_g1~~TRINITY_DN3519_c0_g1_i2.p1  ORF type:complete len:299 (-),score=33.24 TRINITY_DN3519_c0_g1_i2:1488-2384(-)
MLRSVLRRSALLRRTVTAPDGRSWRGDDLSHDGCGSDVLLTMKDGTSIVGECKNWQPIGRCRVVGPSVPQGLNGVVVDFGEGSVRAATARFLESSTEDAKMDRQVNVTWVSSAQHEETRTVGSSLMPDSSGLPFRSSPSAVAAQAGIISVNAEDGYDVSGIAIEGTLRAGECHWPAPFVPKSVAPRSYTYASGPMDEHGRLDGMATLVTCEGTTYRGHFTRGELSCGNMKLADGSYYDGDLNEFGLPHGNGAYRHPDGTTGWDGTWENGKFVQGKLTDEVRENRCAAYGSSVPRVKGG